MTIRARSCLRALLASCSASICAALAALRSALPSSFMAMMKSESSILSFDLRAWFSTEQGRAAHLSALHHTTPLLQHSMLRVVRIPLIAALLLATLVTTTTCLKLHVKAGPDGKTVGDCPFAQAIRLAAGTKGLDMEIIPHAPDSKPEWIMEDHGGKMPLLEDRANRLTDSRAIAAWLELKYPDPSLESAEHLAAAEEAADPVFMAFARYCKSVNEDEEDAAKRKALIHALSKLDAHLAEKAAPYSAGDEMSLCDCFLLPTLHHIKIAGAAFKNFEIPEQYTSLVEYMSTMQLYEGVLLSETSPEPAMVRWGWAQARGDDAAAQAAADELMLTRA
eukprot:CAMPEP_0174696708 /NCGR_PEP_ID=MMETSP1094-20130205/2786_1 /TAXON_ID=156173 /ORGANISM="Chrysochromulina brevifilum, Strain UTEX LB 985" /LENGTH=334 /DNA_ID=CAMNT_0015893539 /DNA_START=164 /DNA_END=1168 /DNA_ORIENTATION=+